MEDPISHSLLGPYILRWGQGLVPSVLKRGSSPTPFCAALRSRTTASVIFGKYRREGASINSSTA